MIFERMKAVLASMFRGYRPPDQSSDPHARVRVPGRRGPKGRDSSIALMEPEPDTFVDADGVRGRQQSQ